MYCSCQSSLHAKWNSRWRQGRIWKRVNGRREWNHIKFQWNLQVVAKKRSTMESFNINSLAERLLSVCNGLSVHKVKKNFAGQSLCIIVIMMQTNSPTNCFVLSQSPLHFVHSLIIIIYLQVWKITDSDDPIIRLDDMPPEADAQMKSQLKQIAAGRSGRRVFLAVIPSAPDAATMTIHYHHSNALLSHL